MSEENSRQRGNATLMGACLLLMFSAWACLYLKKEAALLERLKSKLKTFHCMKSANGQVKSHVREMERLNLAIDASNAALALGTLAPPAIAAARMAKKLAQGAQQTKHFLYLKNFFRLAQEGCLFSVNVFKTPYQNKILLKRDLLGRAKIRSRQWNQKSFSKQIVLKTQVSVTGGQVKLRVSSTKVGALLWRK